MPRMVPLPSADEDAGAVGPPPAPAPSSLAFQAGFVGAFRAVAMVLAVRLILLLVAIGAFVLAWEALASSSTGALIAAGCYYVGVMLPVTLLAARQR